MNRNFFALAAMALSCAFVTPAFASSVEIRGARLDASGENLLVDVAHGGGCQKHEYKLELGGCAESNPVQCRATVKDLTFNACESFVRNTVSFNLKDNGIDGEYYSNGSLTITGERSSSATVYLPVFSGRTPQKSVLPPAAKPKSGQKTVCITNTGANLEINTSTMEATLIPVRGEALTFGITNVDRVSIETNPPIDQTTYSLDDGRKVVTEFRTGRAGTGYYIRIGGEASPEFQSCIQTR